MSENLNLQTISTIDPSPFRHLCVTIGELPSAFVESMSYYELLAWFVNYLENTVIPAVNANGEATAELQELFVELHDYVHDYFDNLDVQEEINNKLDAMAADGTLELLLASYDKCQFIAPKGTSANISSYDANLIIYRNKSIAIDVGYSSVYSEVVAMYSTYGITTLDYVIITHWDADHIGNLGQLITNGVITTDTVVYLPAEPSYISSETINGYKAILTNAGITPITPTTGDHLTFGQLDIKFLNCDLEQLEQYASLSDASNLMSTVLYIKHGMNKAVYVGDADNEALQHLYDTNAIDSSVNLFKISHHGFNTTTSQDFIRAISPDYAIQTSALSRVTDGTTAYCPQITLLDELGCKIYVCGLNNEYIEFVSDGHSMNCKTGHPYTTSFYKAGKTIYVDISVERTAEQDGSSTHPYKELSMALSEIVNKAYDTVTISLADGIYGVTEASPATRKSIPWLSSLKTRILITGNSEDNTAVKIYGLQNYNSSVILENLTILCDYRDGVTVRNGKIVLRSVNITALSDNAVTYKGIVGYDSEITLEGCTISKVAKAFDTANGCKCSVINTTITNVTDSTLIPEIGSSVFNVKNLNEGAYNYQPGSYNPPIVLYVDDNESNFTTGTITLPHNFNEYEALEFALFTPGARIANSPKIYAPRNNIYVPITTTFSSPQYVYLQTVSIKFQNDNELKLDLECRVRITKADGTMTFTEYPDGSGNHYFKFRTVRGIKERIISDESLNANS